MAHDAFASASGSFANDTLPDLDKLNEIYPKIEQGVQFSVMKKKQGTICYSERDHIIHIKSII